MKSAGILRLQQPGQRINSARTIQHQSNLLKQNSNNINAIVWDSTIDKNNDHFNPSATHGSQWTFKSNNGQKYDNNDIAEFESSQYQMPLKTLTQRYKLKKSSINKISMISSRAESKYY